MTTTRTGFRELTVSYIPNVSRKTQDESKPYEQDMKKIEDEIKQKPVAILPFLAPGLLPERLEEGRCSSFLSTTV